ncbi:gephyrin-like isoform X2 [Ptychodera flava]|uniref:gephyrin-like isoform X2 n=1 Tax=Ptychodera flava TaxID=63121 RepID=UPI00396AA51D
MFEAQSQSAASAAQQSLAGEGAVSRKSKMAHRERESSSEDEVVKIGILTVSDRCSRGEAEDKSGPNLAKLVTNEKSLQNTTVTRAIVPDEVDKIQEKLIDWSDNHQFNLVLTTGGTGFAPRDVTPEATKAVIEKECPGMSCAMVMQSMKITPMAMLSRAVCGIRAKTLIVNLPGSTKGAQECFEIVLPALPHALHLLRDDTKKVRKTHTEVQQGHHHHHHHEHSCHGDSKHHRKQDDGHGHHHQGDQIHHHDDVEKVARRPRHSPYPMVTFDEALKSVMDETKTLPVITVDVKSALGYILANDVQAEVSVPPFPASVKDGYAVIAADGTGVRQVISDSTAGTMPTRKVTSGQIMRITTGAPLPPGSDAIVQVEDTELIKDADDGYTELEVRILKEPKVGQDIRPTGVDITKGDIILNCGIKLGPSELGLLASVGVTKVKVHTKPIVAVMSTGNELAEPGEVLEEGHIYDSNRTTLFALLKQHNYSTVDAGIAIDSLESLEKTIKESLEKADVVITTGGVSMGEKDYLKHVLQVKFGAKITFGRVCLKPGKPTTFATLDFKNKKKLFFALPGNPVSCVVCCNLFVLPSLRKMMGYQNPHLTKIKAKLSSDIKLDFRPEFHRAVLDWSQDDAIPSAISTGNQQSSRLLSLKTASALLQLPPRDDLHKELKKSTVVDAFIIAEI